MADDEKKSVELGAVVPHIGSNGNWLMGETDTGKPSRGTTGPQGAKGDTGAQGPKGETGPAGPQGPKGDTGDTGPAGPKGDTGAKGETGAQGPAGATGAQGPKGDKGDAGATGPQGPQGVKGDTGAAGADGKSAYAYAKDGGFTGTETQFATLLNITVVTPQMYGAKGDGSTDDTKAFQSALAAHRIVRVPGGTYKLSAGITIRDNCELQLSQDTVLSFTGTSGNCISMKSSASLRGNHATITVPYAFAGNVIYIGTDLATELNEVPPFAKWDPQWKVGRYITDVNIVKPDSRGFYYSIDGKCNGTAIYVYANGNNVSTFIWACNFSGVRIAGAFSYGIRSRVENASGDSGWNHDMRIEAVIDAAEVGVSLENTNNAFLDVVVQPRRAYTTSETYAAYAKWGIRLENSRNADLSKSRIWDWSATNTLWTAGGQYQHLAMIGNCSGLILNDFLYYEQSSSDIRDLIYTDNVANLEKMTILQEPITRWFRPVDGEPYFNDGKEVKKLCTEEDLEAHFDTQIVKKFTDLLATATDGAGAVFNGIGYKVGQRIDTDGKTLTTSSGNACTGYIPCKQGDVIRTDGLSLKTYDGYCRTYFYDASYNLLTMISASNLTSGSNYYAGYTETENGMTVTPKNELEKVAYVRFCVLTANVGANPVVAANEEIKMEAAGFLADGIRIKASNVEGLEAFIKQIIAST